MTREEERKLIVAWRERGDAKALKKLIDQHKPLIRSQAMRYVNTRIGLDDLMQQGAMGIMRAAETFDLDSENRFVTYARWFTKRDISSCGRANSTVAFVPQGQMNGKARQIWDEWQDEMKNAVESGDDCSEEAVITRISQKLGLTEKKVKGAISVRHMREHRTDAIIPGAEDNVVAKLPPQMTVTETAEDHYAAEQAAEVSKTIIEKIMASLDPREKDIITRRKLSGQTLEAVAGVYGLSRERIRQIEVKAMTKMAEAGAGLADEARSCLSALSFG